MKRARAVIYIGGTLDSDVAKRRGLEHCEMRGYQLVSIVEECDDETSRWRDAFAVLADGHADVLVVAVREDLPTDQSPRLEVAGDGLSSPVTSQRRPRRNSAPQAH